MALEPADGPNDRGGVVETLAAKPARPVLGVRSAADPLGIRLTHVLDGGAAQQAGLSGGDVVVAIDRLKAVDLDKALARFQPGETVKLHAFRRDELMAFNVRLQAAPADTCRLMLQPADARWLKH